MQTIKQIKMKQYKIGEVFIDPETNKRLKCVEDAPFSICEICFYNMPQRCLEAACRDDERDDEKSVHFTETTEPLTE